MEQSPSFAQNVESKLLVDNATEALHVALVKIKNPSSYDDAVLHGIGRTLSQLSELGLSCVVVVDDDPRQDNGSNYSKSAKRAYTVEQADRLVTAIGLLGGKGARRVDSLISISQKPKDTLLRTKYVSRVKIVNRNLLLAPLRRGMIPIVAPIGFNSVDQTIESISADELIVALTQELAGFVSSFGPEEEPHSVANRVKSLQKQIMLDRIIILDETGGIPPTGQHERSHVFINLEQEYEEIHQKLSKASQKSRNNNEVGGTRVGYTGTEPGTQAQISSGVNPLTRPPQGQPLHNPGDIEIHQKTSKNHMHNLQLLHDTLSILPSSSSGLLTTPEEVANSGIRSTAINQAPRVGTRPQRNPLIHNLLTDKPVFSSSLPSARLARSSPRESPPLNPAMHHVPRIPTTFVKRGMPITIFPDPRTQPWEPPALSSPPGETLQLSDPRIDLPRLVHLIEDSFNRKLDVQHYLDRIKDRLAGIIIAGAYEGGAILTWEIPPSSSTSPTPPPHHHHDHQQSESQIRQVPYLDKFAVLQRSQGAGGVADIVFSAMVRDCFPHGVCWRSRRDNPVNKWYFERARGSWDIGSTGWTMFWTTEGVSGQTFLDYEAVCRGVVPSWSDGKSALD